MGTALAQGCLVEESYGLVAPAAPSPAKAFPADGAYAVVERYCASIC